MLPQPTLRPVQATTKDDPRQQAIARSKRRKFYNGLATYLIGVSIGCILLGLLYQARRNAMAQRQQQQLQQQKQFEQQQLQRQQPAGSHNPSLTPPTP